MWLNTVKFKDRLEAGEKLAVQLQGKFDLVLAIPRGGVVVGQVVADRLGLPLRIVVTKKVGAPGQEELAIGAMGPDGKVVWDRALLEKLNLDKSNLAAQVKNAKFKIKNYKEKFPTSPLRLRSGLRGTSKIILVDDGVATGSTMEAAIKYLRARRYPPRAITVAVPVCAPEAYGKLAGLADAVVCLAVPEDFGAVGQFYEHFPQVTDDEVVAILGA